MMTGDRLKIFTHSLLKSDEAEGRYNGIIQSVEEVETDEIKGTIVTAQIEGYGQPQPFFEPASSVLSGRISERRANSGMPKNFVDKEARDFKFNIYQQNTDYQKKICNAYIQSFRKGVNGTGLYIHSKTPGSGKTMLSCCIANEILKRNDICLRFITASDFIQLKFKSDKKEADWDKIKSIKKSTLLILDDLGANNSKDSIDNALFDLIDYRNKNNLATIYTSNLGKTELREKFNERVVSRILDSSIPVVMPEESIRDRQSKEKVDRRLKAILNNVDEENTCFE